MAPYPGISGPVMANLYAGSCCAMSLEASRLIGETGMNNFANFEHSVLSTS